MTGALRCSRSERVGLALRREGLQGKTKLLKSRPKERSIEEVNAKERN